MSKKYKVLYLHQYFNTPSMKGGTRSYEFARRMVDVGHEVHMVTSRRESAESSFSDLENVDGISVHWLPVDYSNHMPFQHRILAFLKFSFLAALRSISIKADVVYATSTPLTIFIPGVVASKWHKIPMIFEVRDLWPELPVAVGALKSRPLIWLARKMELYAYRQSKAIVALSSGMKEGVVEKGIPPSKVHVIPNACDITLFRATDSEVADFIKFRPWLESSSPLLLYAGTLGHINGVMYLVDLAIELRRLGSNINILIVGDGADRRKIEEAGLAAGVLGNNLFMEEAVSKRDVAVAYCAATMVASLFLDIPAMQANSANKFFDALASGAPVFLNYGGWQKELIEKHACGYSGHGVPLDVVALELHRIMRNGDELLTMGRNAFSLAKSEFNRDVLFAKLNAVVCDVGNSVNRLD